MNSSRVECSLLSENVAWLYDSEAELLNDPDIRRIVLYGSRTADQKLRLLLADISPEKIRVAENSKDIPGKLICRGTDMIFLLFGLDNYFTFRKKKVEAAVLKRVEEEQR